MRREIADIESEFADVAEISQPRVSEKHDRRVGVVVEAHEFPAKPNSVEHGENHDVRRAVEFAKITMIPRPPRALDGIKEEEVRAAKSVAGDLHELRTTLHDRALARHGEVKREGPVEQPTFSSEFLQSVRPVASG